MKIAITGATGFVGSHLIRHLSKEGHEIIAYGRTSSPPEQLKQVASYQQWNLDDFLLPKAFDGDVFIHTAGFVEFWGSYEDMYKTNVEGTLKALGVAKNAKHFIYISSASVYDSWKDKRKVSENARLPKQYANNYALTKSEAEKIILKKADNFKNVTIIRPHAIYGPGDRTLVSRILASISNNKTILVGSGNNKFSITHIGNLCYGISLIIHSKQKGLKIYNLTDSENLAINEIYEHLFNALNLKVKIVHIPYFMVKPLAFSLEKIFKLVKSKKPPLLTTDVARQFTQESTLSLEKITLELKYRPPFTNRDGFKDLKIWIDSIGGLANYLSSPIDCWNGQLITY